MTIEIRNAARLVLPAALLLAPAPGRAAGPPVGAAETLDRNARILAGLPVPGPQVPCWEAHARVVSERWAALERRRLAPMRAWARVELKQAAAAPATVFYPFSGPDFLYAETFFPEATEYVLVGLEPVGQVPDLPAMEPPAAEAYLGAVRRALDDVVAFSFFKTNNMSADLAADSLKGVVPLLLLFVARAGGRVEDVSFVDLDAAGALCAPVSAAPMGVRIAYRFDGERDARHVEYFAADLSDHGGSRKARLFRRVEGHGRVAVFVKSASYLMHKTYYSQVRQLVLEVGRVILQDDSGVPYRYLRESKCALRNYGSYAGPTHLFRGWAQQDLAESYAAHAQPLPFGIGYAVRKESSNLQLAVCP